MPLKTVLTVLVPEHLASLIRNHARDTRRRLQPTLLRLLQAGLVYEWRGGLQGTGARQSAAQPKPKRAPRARKSTAKRRTRQGAAR